MTNVWKKMEIGKVYEALKSMTPEERLKDLYDTQKELDKAISKSIKDETDKNIITYIDDYIKDILPEYSDYSYPEEAMLSEVDDIIHDMIETEEFYELLRKRIRSLLWENY